MAPEPPVRTKSEKVAYLLPLLFQVHDRLDRGGRWVGDEIGVLTDEITRRGYDTFGDHHPFFGVRKDRLLSPQRRGVAIVHLAVDEPTIEAEIAKGLEVGAPQRGVLVVVDVPERTPGAARRDHVGDIRSTGHAVGLLITHSGHETLTRGHLGHRVSFCSGDRASTLLIS